MQQTDSRITSLMLQICKWLKLDITISNQSLALKMTLHGHWFNAFPSGPKTKFSQRTHRIYRSEPCFLSEINRRRTKTNSWINKSTTIAHDRIQLTISSKEKENTQNMKLTKLKTRNSPKQSFNQLTQASNFNTLANFNASIAINKAESGMKRMNIRSRNHELCINLPATQRIFSYLRKNRGVHSRNRESSRNGTITRILRNVYIILY